MVWYVSTVLIIFINNTKLYLKDVFIVQSGSKFVPLEHGTVLNRNVLMIYP